MLIGEKIVKLKNEHVCILRNPKPDDAVQLVEYLKATAAETDFLLKYPEEVRITAEQEREFIESLNGSKSDLSLLFFYIIATIMLSTKCRLI